MPAKKITANDVISKRQFGTMNAEQIVTYCKIIGANPEEIFAEYCKERSARR